MEVTANQWRYGGAALLAGVSSLIFAVGIMNVWVPMPLHLVLVAWAAHEPAVLLTPAIYLLTLKLASSSRRFPHTVGVLIAVFAALSVWYFYESWSYGVQYQGVTHTRVVAAENVVGFGAALSISVWSLLRKSQPATYLANFLLFALLSWCAFPYLGELP